LWKTHSWLAASDANLGNSVAEVYSVPLERNKEENKIGLRKI
jgi:hypothetical protein